MKTKISPYIYAGLEENESESKMILLKMKQVNTLTKQIEQEMRNIHNKMKDKSERDYVFKDKDSLNKNEIISCVCMATKSDISAVNGIDKNSRKQQHVWARHLSAYFLKKHNNMVFREIGDAVGGKDHATALHSIKTIENLLSVNDQKVIEMVDSIEKLINEQKIKKQLL